MFQLNKVNDFNVCVSLQEADLGSAGPHIYLHTTELQRSLTTAP